MRLLIDDVRLLERKTTTNNDKDVLPVNLNVSQENKQETPKYLQKENFQSLSETGTLAPGRAMNFIYN